MEVTSTSNKRKKTNNTNNSKSEPTNKRQKATPTTKRKKSSPSTTKTDDSNPWLTAFPPIVSETVPPHTLILGTMPSVKSLAEHQYFAHPQNAFWTIVGSALGFNRKTTPYPVRTVYLTAAGFALWDVLKGCHRIGSLDSAIEKEAPNDLPTFVQNNPSIKRIVINSKASATFFKKHFKSTWLQTGTWRLGNDKAHQVFAPIKSNGEDDEGKEITLYVLHSTSPAHATVTFKEKEREWHEICFSHRNQQAATNSTKKADSEEKEEEENKENKQQETQGKK